MPYLTVDTIKAHTRAVALTEDFEIPELGGAVRIVGISDYEAIQATRAKLADMLRFVEEGSLNIPLTNGFYKPSEATAVAAVWAEACVAEPKMTATEWLQFAHEGDDILARIQHRACVCTRLIPDVAAGIPDGIDACIKALKNDGDMRAFVELCINKLHRLPSEVLRDNPGIKLEEITQALASVILQNEDLQAMETAGV